MHVEFVRHNLKDVEFFNLKVAQEGLVRSVGCVGVRAHVTTSSQKWTFRSALLLVDLLKETGATILKLYELLWLELAHIVGIVGSLFRMVTLV